MKRKAASILGLLGFAAVAIVEAVKGGDFAQAVPRALFAAVLMAAIGGLAGFVAERALKEAVDASMPAYTADETAPGEESTTAEQEAEA